MAYDGLRDTSATPEWQAEPSQRLQGKAAFAEEQLGRVPAHLSIMDWIRSG
jgi:hypothetical protein